MKSSVRPGEGSSPSPSPGSRLYPHQEQFIRSCGQRRNVVLIPLSNTVTGRDADDWHRILQTAHETGFFNK